MQRIKIVSFLFIVVGSASVIQFILTIAIAGIFSPGVEMILLPAGVGLIRRNEVWRKVSIAVCVSGLFLVILVPVLGYTISPIMHVRVFGTTLDSTSWLAVLFVIVYGALLFLSLLWVTLALTNKKVRQDFADG